MTTEIKTEHPHVVRIKGVCGGDPVIKGTRISVPFLARFVNGGSTVDEIVAMYPNLTLAMVHDAISYYYDHRAEIDQIIAESTPEAVNKRLGLTISDGRILFDR